MKILDGEALAKKEKAEIKESLTQLKTELKKVDTQNNGADITLGIIIVGDNPASKKYVELKLADCEEVGIATRVLSLPESISTEILIENINNFSNDDAITGIIVQLPLPKHIDIIPVLTSIPFTKDADSLSTFSLGRIFLDIDDPMSIGTPCTPQAVLDIADHYKIEFEGKRTLVIGRGLTVGRYLPAMLTNKKYNATVTHAHSKTKNLNELIKGSDIVISCAGAPGIVNKENVKKGAVLFDVGISRKDGKLVGDIDKNVEEIASALCPNPKGVGPMTRANLLKNLCFIKQLEYMTAFENSEFEQSS